MTARTMFRTGFILCALVTGPILHRVTAETMHLRSVRLCRSMAETVDWYCGLSQVTTAMAILRAFLAALLVAVSCIIQALRGQLAQPVLSGSGKERSITFRHHPPDSARTGYATKGALFISAQQLLSTNAVSARRRLMLISLWKQHSVQART